MRCRKYVIWTLSFLCCAGGAVAFLHRLNDQAQADAAGERSIWDDNAVQATIGTGNSLIQALNNYKAKNKKYPTELRELVPKFVSEVSPPVAGNSGWVYGTSDDGQQFVIKFGVGTYCYPCYFRDSQCAEWHRDS